MNIGVRTSIKINGVPVAGHSTILSAGFNVIGRRIFDSAYTNQIKWIRFDFDDYPNFTVAATYTETSSTVHKISYSWVASLSAPVIWSAMAAMFANSTLDADRAATFSAFTPGKHTVNNGDTCNVDFTFTFSGTDWQADGFKAIGHRCFDPSNSYALPNYFSFYNGGAEQKRYLGAYANVSNTVHDLSTTFDADVTADSVRLYNASSGGTACFANTASRTLLNGHPWKFRLTIGQT